MDTDHLKYYESQKHLYQVLEIPLDLIFEYQEIIHTSNYYYLPAFRK